MENEERAQHRLIAKGFALEADGDFGAQSYAALMSFVGDKTTVSLLRLELGRAAARHFPGAALSGRGYRHRAAGGARARPAIC